MGQTTLRMKNGRAWTNAGAMVSIVDYPTQQITLVNEGRKSISRLGLTDLHDLMLSLMTSSKSSGGNKEMPEEAKKAMEAALANMKTSFESKKTGRVDTIQDIQAEEREATLTIEMPGPAGGRAPAMTMKMVMQIWTAKAEETLRNQAVRELTGYNIYANYFMNPAGMLQKMTANLPGAGNAFKAMAEDFSKNKTIMLRTRTSMYVPLPGMPDPNTALFDMTQEAVEVSSTPIEEAVFEIPADYKTIPSDEFMKSFIQDQVAAMGMPAK
jgi:hypothetical protein